MPAFWKIFVPAVSLLFGICQYLRDWVPYLPGTEVGILHLGAGEVPAHLAGAAVFALAGFYSAHRALDSVSYRGGA